MVPQPLGVQSMSYGRDAGLPPPPPPPLSPRNGHHVPKYMMDGRAPPPPPMGPPPTNSPRASGVLGGVTSKNNTISPSSKYESKAIMEERRRAAYAIYNADSPTNAEFNKEENPVATDESSDEEDRHVAPRGHLRVSSGQDENNWDYSTLHRGNSSPNGSTPVSLDNFMTEISEPTKVLSSRSSKSARSPSTGSKKKTSTIKSESNSSRKSSVGDGKAKGKKGFFQKILGRKDKDSTKTKNKRTDKHVGRPKSVKSGQSYMSTTRSAEIVVKQEPHVPAQEPPGLVARSPPMAPPQKALEPGGVLLRGAKPASLQVMEIADHEINESFSSPRFEDVEVEDQPDHALASSGTGDFLPGMGHVDTMSGEWSAGGVSEMTDPSFMPKSPPAPSTMKKNNQKNHASWDSRTANEFPQFRSPNFFAPDAPEEMSFAIFSAGQLDDSSVETPPANETKPTDIGGQRFSSPNAVASRENQTPELSFNAMLLQMQAPPPPPPPRDTGAVTASPSAQRNNVSPSTKTSPNFSPEAGFSSMPRGDRKIDSASVLVGLAVKASKRRALIAKGEATYAEPTLRKKNPAATSQPMTESPFFIDDKDAKDPIHRAGRLLLSKSAVPIQAEVRRFLAQREAVDRLWALVQLQSYFRRWRCEAFRLAHTSAVQIQRTVRGHLASMRAYDRVYRIIRIQAVMRGALAREELPHLLYVRNDFAATTIQTAWRCYNTQLHYQFDVVDIIVVQTLARRWLANRQMARFMRFGGGKGPEFVEYDAAARIQAAWRGFKGFTEFIFSMADIIIAQRTARKWLAIKKVRSMRVEKSATVIQSAWRGFWGFSHYLILHYEVVKVQALWRGYRDRRSARLQLGCSILLQAVARGYFAKRDASQAKTNRLIVLSTVVATREYNSARRIQRWWVKVSTFTRERRAALVIQRFFRMVKVEVDREIDRQAKKRGRRKRDKKEPDGAMLERAWLTTTESQSESKSGEKRRGKSRADRRRARKGNHHRGRATPSSVRMRRDDDAVSDVTAPTALARAPPKVRRSTLSGRELHEDLSLEEAWIDTEVRRSKEQRRDEEAYMRRYGLRASSGYRGAPPRNSRRVPRNDGYRSDDPRRSDRHRSNEMRRADLYRSGDRIPTSSRSLGRSSGRHSPMRAKSPSRGLTAAPRHYQVPSRDPYEDELQYHYEGPVVGETYDESPEAYYGHPPHNRQYSDELEADYEQEYPEHYMDHRQHPRFESPRSTGRPHNYARGSERRYPRGGMRALV